MAWIDLSLLLHLLSWIISLVLCQRQRPIELNLTEEAPVGTFIGNLRRDALLEEKYTETQMRRLQFKFLSKKSPHIDLLKLDETTGMLSSASVVDRDQICPKAEQCQIKADVVVQPRDFYQVIKVTVSVIDINDNAPEFQRSQVTLNLPESTVPDSRFPVVSAKDKDSPAFGVAGYHLVTDNSRFHLLPPDDLQGPLPLQLVIKTKLDREDTSSHEVQIVTYDKGNPPLSSTLTLTITVEDTNDNKPVFNITKYTFDAYEGIRIGTSIGQVHAEDPDEGLNGEVTYSLEGNEGNVFNINEITGDIYTVGELDYEGRSSYTISVSAKDKGPFALPSFASVEINILDKNDHSPEIDVNTFSESDIAQVRENQAPGSVVAHVTVSDADQGANGRASCALDNPMFNLPSSYGSEYDIVTAQMLDREQQSHYNLTLECKDGGYPQRSSRKEVRVRISDENDNKPIFRGLPYIVTVQENNNIGKLLINVSATDLDAGRNGDITYTTGGQSNKYVTMDSVSGAIRAKVAFDFESIKRYEIPVTAIDHGSPLRQSATTTVTILVQDENDEVPRFKENTYFFDTQENKPSGTQVGRVMARDDDGTPYNQFTYSIDYTSNYEHSHKFYINPKLGTIRTKTLLDRESKDLYALKIFAKESQPPHRNSSCVAKVFVRDENDNSPIVDFPNPFNNTVHVAFNIPPRRSFARIVAHDDDLGDNARLSYSIPKDKNNGTFIINSQTGSVSFKFVPDIGDMGFMTLPIKVFVSDNGNPSRATYAEMNVVLDKSVIYTGPSDSSASTSKNAFLSDENMKIIIIVSGIFGFLIIILLVVLICVKRRQHPRPSREAERFHGTSRVQVRLLEPISKIDASIPNAWTTPMEEFGKDNMFPYPGGRPAEPPEQETLYVPQRGPTNQSGQYTGFGVSKCVSCI